jgi:cytochrome c-type biogenesis protein CcmE
VKKSSIKFIVAAVVIIGAVAWLAISGARDSKSYYVTISELQAMGNGAYSKNLRVAGNVAPGSISRSGPNASFTLLEQG